MTLNDLRAQGRLRPHRTSRRELDDLLRLAERDLVDASIAGLSTDRRFMIAYEAAVALATIPLYASGFRTEGTGHHQTTFVALPLVMGDEFADPGGLLRHVPYEAQSQRVRSHGRDVGDGGGGAPG